MDDERIEIVEDIDGKITYDEIRRKNLCRADVAAAEERLAVLEKENADYLSKIEANNAEIESIKAEIAKAKDIIAIADAKKVAEAEIEAQAQEEPAIDEVPVEVAPENIEQPQESVAPQI